MTKFNYKKISGIVISGQGKGRRLGFPTMNIELADGLESGVYAGIVNVRGQNYEAGIFISRDGKNLEAHLKGFSGNLHGEKIEVEIVEKIREVMNFRNEKELIKQIGEDIESITQNSNVKSQSHM